ncbi:MAG: FMN-dependent NADH-azoreductase [Gammaproteobacteria bacterium]
MNILHIDASPLGGASLSRQLTASVVEKLTGDHPSADVVHRDLTESPISHLSGELLQVLRPAPGSTPPSAPTLRAEAAQTDTLIAELLGADVVVIGAPMFNFSIPSQLKAWIDRVAQAGRTFRYTAEGPIGLAVGKKAIIVSTRGGVYAGTAYEAAMDHQEAYLRTVLNFLGITDVTYVRAEGVAMSAEKREEAIATANRHIADLRVEYPRAA